MIKRWSKETHFRRKNSKWLYDIKPPENNEENWYIWHEYHHIDLKTDLEFCNGCGRILVPKYTYSHLSKDHKIIYSLCLQCDRIRSKIQTKLEECLNLRKKIQHIAKEQRRKNHEK